MNQRMARFLLPAAQALVLALGIAAPAEAAGASKAVKTAAPSPAAPEPELRLFKEATFLLPQGAKIEPRWVLPPTDKTHLPAIFSASAKDSAVLALPGVESGMSRLLHPQEGYAVSVGAEISGMVHLANGVLLLAAGSDIVLPAAPKEKTFDKKGVPVVGLQPVARLPLEKIDVLASAGNTVYCAGRDPRSGRYAVYVLRSVKGAGLLDLERAYESNEAVSAVTGDEEALYVARGRKVVKISLKGGGETPYYAHPSATVSGLALTPAGLLASTDREIVLAGRNGALEIMRSSGHRMALHGDTLYAFFPRSLGVLALDRVSDLGRFNLAVRPAAPDEMTSPLAVAGVRFFESAGLDNAAGFTDSFNRKDVRRIVAQIEFAKPAAKSNRVHAVTVSWFEPTGGQLASTVHQVAAQAGKPLLAAIGGEDGGGYSAPHQLSRDGPVWAFGKDKLGTRYPGRYRMRLHVDGVPAGEWPFVLAGQPEPWEAIAYDDLAALKTLLDQGLSPNYKNDQGTPLLHSAFVFGSAGAVKMLLERGANPNETDKEGRPPLASMMANDWQAKAELLVRNGANVNAASSAGRPPLVDSFSHSADKLAFLIRNGARIQYETKYGKRSLLGELGRSNCTEELVSLLVQHGANLNEIFESYPYASPLGNAISRADEKCVELLLKKGASTAIVQKEKIHPPRSALWLALTTLAGRTDPKDKAVLRRIVRLLQQNGATLRPGKKISTSALLYISSSDDYNRWADERSSINSGEGRMMFRGEGPAFFDPMDMAKTLEQDDAALEEASLSSDLAIRRLALGTHLNRVRELTGLAKNESDLRFTVHTHCEEAFKLAEADYRPLQADLVADIPPGGQGRPQLGIKLLKRPSGGAYVQGVLPGSPAASAGLKAGDIILALDTQKMKDDAEIVAAAARLTPGMPVRATLLRDDPMQLPDLQLSCGLVEREVRDLRGFAEMNLSRWLAAHPEAAAAGEVRKRLAELAAGGRR